MPLKSKEKAKLYRERLKAKVFMLLGGKCAVCGDVDIRNLKLHHISYGVDSIRHNNSRMESRYLEAKKHPERFVLLCKVHHPWGMNTRPPSIPITRWEELYEEDMLYRFVNR